VREQELRDYLGRFRFGGDFVNAKIGTMSGGEKARLALALITWDKPNLLVLDEPTNHLDMATREALTMALSTFEGSLLLVSHDRHLLRSTCDKLVLVHEGEVSEYDGDLDDYAALVLEHRKAVLEAEKQAARAERPAAETASVNRREERRLEAQERARKAALKKPLQKKLDAVEKELQSVRADLDAMDARIADADWYQSTPQDEVSETMRKRGELASRCDELEMSWLEISEEIEAIG
jgi:ATP-binding cassette subfamily F protein 3